MEHLVHMVMFLLLALFFIRLSFFDLKTKVAVAALGAAMLPIMHPVLVNTSKHEVSSLFSNFATLTDWALIISIEIGLLITWAFATSKIPHQGNNVSNYLTPAATKFTGNQDTYGTAGKKSWLIKVLNHFPGLTFMPVSWYMLTRAFFYFTGVDFGRVTFYLGITLITSIIIFPAIIKALLPEINSRRELLFITGILTLLLATIATVQGTVMFDSTGSIEWWGMLVFILAAAILAGVGYALKKFNINPVTRMGRLFKFSSRANARKNAA